MSVNNIGCTLNNSFRITSCSLGQAGVLDVFLLPASQFNLSLCTFDSNDKITAFNQVITWFQMAQVSETAEWMEKDVRDAKTGSIFWDQTLTMLFHHNSSVIRKQLLQMFNSPTVAIIRDNSGRAHLAGATRKLYPDAELKIEKSYGGLNGQVVQLKGTEPYPAYEVNFSAVTYSGSYVQSGVLIHTQGGN